MFYILTLLLLFGSFVVSDVLYSRIVMVNGHGKGWNRNGSSWFGILHDLSFSFFFFGGFCSICVCVYFFFFFVGFVVWVWVA